MGNMGYRNIDAPWHFLVMRNDVQLVKKTKRCKAYKDGYGYGFYYGEAFFS